MYPAKFENLIAAFRRLPGVGMKTAERYAFEALNWDEETRKEVERSLQQISEIHICRICGNLCDEDECEYCKDPNRTDRLICVVQSPKDLQALESAGVFNGKYHVLNGTINMAEGVLPSDLNIDTLIQRINENIDEVILATEPTVDGETTALYLTKLLQGKVKVTRLANGIPMGGHLDYSDARTLQRAFQGRINAQSE